MKFHIIGVECSIHWNCPILATQNHRLQLHGVWIPIVNRTWTPFISPISLKQIVISRWLNAHVWIEMARFLCKHKSSYLMFPVQIGNILLPNKTISCHGFSYIVPCPRNCLVFILYLFDGVTKAQLGPNMIFKNLGHLWNILWHVGHRFGIMMVKE